MHPQFAPFLPSTFTSNFPPTSLIQHAFIHLPCPSTTTPHIGEESSAKKAKTDQGNVEEAPNSAYQAEDADITLRSSDGLEFKAHKYILKASSKTFCDMLTLGTNDDNATIELTDTRIEDSEIMKQFLDLAYSKAMVDFPLEKAELGSLPDLVDFFLKYEATFPMFWFKASQQVFISTSEVDPLDMFMLGAQLDSVDVCATAIRCESDREWDTSDIATNGAGRRHVLDLTALSLPLMERIPSRYVWALLRASSAVSPGENVWHDWDKRESNWWVLQKRKIAKEFESLMKSPDCKK
ncbi:hypothetical protein I302_102805 [Kwoniella bestiolae CBS 10118]|uniref:BTB domain-containing protein n=1 Tax=Kwoniella bestiolae CBS 10118 TaxID=1296100 RepID=A0A1B9GG02_9TREE|nr:hypothetical protein I302_01500 [Kwoniella bestiolae CBS 10118]OCF29983.1 hypothetical protein I302_01500 [Kwoniella bestiolae CBS 10118]